MPDRWSVRVPAGATTGEIVIRTPHAMFTGPTFRVTAAPPSPVVHKVTPARGAPGTEVTITGENFSPRLTDNQVLLGNRPVVVRMATPTTLQVIVPEGASTGPFTVQVSQAGGAQSPPFTVMASTAIADIHPRLGPPGTEVTLRGTGFSAERRDDRVFLSNRRARVLRASPNELVVSIPGRAASGPLLVDVRNAGRAESPIPFTVQDPPLITAITPGEHLVLRRVNSATPPSAAPGRMVTIHGANFTDDPRLVRVTIGSRSLVLRRATQNALVVEVPPGVPSGKVTVSVAGLTVTSAATLTVLTPMAITGFAPHNGPAGTVVSIRGRGFSPRPADNRVTLQNAEAQVEGASPNELRVRIPATHSGPISVEVANNGAASTRQPFVMTTPPFVAGFSPAFGAPGTPVTIRGVHFGNELGLVEASLGGRPMTIRSVTDTSILAVVPPNAATGRIDVKVRLQGEATANSDFRVVAPFRLAALIPARGYTGMEIAVRGQGFAPQGASVVFDGVRRPVAATFVGPTELRVIVPRGAQTGPVNVRLPDGRMAASGVPFTVIAPPSGMGVQSIEALCSRPGCKVVIHGWGFSAQPHDDQVHFAGRPMRVQKATATILQVTLPRTPGTTGTFEITVRHGGHATSQPFTVTQ